MSTRKGQLYFEMVEKIAFEVYQWIFIFCYCQITVTFNFHHVFLHISDNLSQNLISRDITRKKITRAFIWHQCCLNPVSVDLRFDQITLDIQPFFIKIPTLDYIIRGPDIINDWIILILLQLEKSLALSPLQLQPNGEVHCWTGTGAVTKILWSLTPHYRP